MLFVRYKTKEGTIEDCLVEQTESYLQFKMKHNISVKLKQAQPVLLHRKSYFDIYKKKKKKR